MASTSSSYDFHNLSAGDFEKVGSTIVGKRFDLPQIQLFADGRDGGRDAAANVVTMVIGGEKLENQHLVVQVKHTNKVGAKVTDGVRGSVFLSEIGKVKVLVKDKQLDIYILITNYSMPAEQEKKINIEFQKAGVSQVIIAGKETLESWIRESRDLREELPRLYNIGRPNIHDKVEKCAEDVVEIKDVMNNLVEKVVSNLNSLEACNDIETIYRRNPTYSTTVKIPTEVFTTLSKESGLMKKWKFVGRGLKVSEGCLDEIDHSCIYLSEKVYKMLTTWQDDYGGNAEMLAKALSGENLNRLVELLWEELKYRR